MNIDLPVPFYVNEYNDVEMVFDLADFLGITIDHIEASDFVSGKTLERIEEEYSGAEFYILYEGNKRPDKDTIRGWFKDEGFSCLGG